MAVTTRSQARAKNMPMMTRARSKGIAPHVPPPSRRRVTQRKRTFTETPKGKKKVVTRGKPPKSNGRTRKLNMSIRVPHHMPTTPGDLAGSFEAPPSPPTPLSLCSAGPVNHMDTNTSDDVRLSNPSTPIRPSGPRVRFDVQTLSLVRQAPTTENPTMDWNEFAAGISSDWVRSPGGTSQRLIVVPEDRSDEAERQRREAEQANINAIFQTQYDRLMADRADAERRHLEFLRQHGEEDDAMEI